MQIFYDFPFLKEFKDKTGGEKFNIRELHDVPVMF